MVSYGCMYGPVQLLALFLTLAGYCVGLGAVTVIDFHAWLGRTSCYWKEASTRTHKVTKPLIWTGLILAVIGSTLLYAPEGWTWNTVLQAGIAAVLIANGLYLSLAVSPRLLQQERQGRADQLLDARLQRIIFWSFTLSWICWWSEAALFTWFLFRHMRVG